MQEAKRGRAIHLDTRVVPGQLLHRLLAGFVRGQVHRRFLRQQRPGFPLRAKTAVKRPRRGPALTAVEVSVVLHADFAPQGLSTPSRPFVPLHRFPTLGALHGRLPGLP